MEGGRYALLTALYYWSNVSSLWLSEKHGPENRKGNRNRAVQADASTWRNELKLNKTFMFISPYM